MAARCEHPIVVPELGAGPSPIQVCTWLTLLGETVHQGDRIVELSLPGMTFDINSPVGGRLIALVKTIGDVVKTGDILGIVMTDD